MAQELAEDIVNIWRELLEGEGQLERPTGPGESPQSGEKLAHLQMIQGVIC